MLFPWDISEICFTDHVDYGVKEDWPDGPDTYQPEEKAALPAMNVKYPAYHAEIKQIKRKYNGRITIREGMEFGMPGTYHSPIPEALLFLSL